jgi:hypothetical protein
MRINNNMTLILKHFLRNIIILSNVLIFYAFQLSSEEANIYFHGKIDLNSQKIFETYKYSEKSHKQLALGFSKSNFNARINFNQFNKNTSFDKSFIEYKNGLTRIGLGTIDRNWSFSPINSLILSDNAPPTKSMYFKFGSDKRPDLFWLYPLGRWSVDLFNGVQDISTEPENPMILGVRGVIEPLNGLKFEILQTSQWGGVGTGENLQTLSSAIFGNTNEGKDRKINRMAGFGFSYRVPKKTNYFRIYGQAIGEDESGNLPSCYMFLYGAEWKNNINEYPLTFNLEIVDTRIDHTENMNCGPNTAYNNSVYLYTNRSRVMGASIDSEGNSAEFSAKVEISEKTELSYIVKNVHINDKNNPNHRLSSDRQQGVTHNLNLVWHKNKAELKLGVSHSGLSLDNINIKSGTNIMLSTKLTF